MHDTVIVVEGTDFAGGGTSDGTSLRIRFVPSDRGTAAYGYTDPWAFERMPLLRTMPPDPWVSRSERVHSDPSRNVLTVAGHLARDDRPRIPPHPSVVDRIPRSRCHPRHREPGRGSRARCRRAS